jgi:hypothetical protein
MRRLRLDFLSKRASDALFFAGIAAAAALLLKEALQGGWSLFFQLGVGRWGLGARTATQFFERRNEVVAGGCDRQRVPEAQHALAPLEERDLGHPAVLAATQLQRARQGDGTESAVAVADAHVRITEHDQARRKSE